MTLITKVKLNPDIKYRKKLNKLNLDVREKIADAKMFYPFETKEEQKIMQNIENWKKEQQLIIYNECYNPKPSLLSKMLSFFR